MVNASSVFRSGKAGAAQPLKLAETASAGRVRFIRSVLNKINDPIVTPPPKFAFPVLRL